MEGVHFIEGVHSRTIGWISKSPFHGLLEMISIKGEPFLALSFRGTEGAKSPVPLCAPHEASSQGAKRTGVWGSDAPEVTRNL